MLKNYSGKTEHMNIPCDAQLLETLRKRQYSCKVNHSRGFAWSLDFASPYIATAIHAGSHVPEQMLPLMKMSRARRLFEEDCATDIMIQGLSNTVWGLDSRAVYDLNRSVDLALPLTPDKFWGATVYKKMPHKDLTRQNLQAHDDYYKFMGSCITFMLEKFDRCIVYDIHSYNTIRQLEKGISNPPVFNLGTALVDRKKWAHEIDLWLDILGQIPLPDMETTVAENHVFQGLGEHCRRLTQWDPRILVLPTEVAKIYMDEMSGNIFTHIVIALQRGICQAVNRHQEFFI
ncbi:MAG: N-formylglutamate amidohydrolase [Desulfamplus sp.]|nr:N-formylglutamate amidohydrolase [Desulfamplus sp.]